jgi:hypothetical protein
MRWSLPEYWQGVGDLVACFVVIQIIWFVLQFARTQARAHAREKRQSTAPPIMMPGGPNPAILNRAPPTVEPKQAWYAISLISDERQRQIDVEGWTAEHDDKHDKGEMAKAAAVYATITQETGFRIFESPLQHGWPWGIDWLRPFAEPPADDPRFDYSFPHVDRLRCLVKAGALIAAEIDRVLRLKEKEWNENES